MFTHLDFVCGNEIGVQDPFFEAGQRISSLPNFLHFFSRAIARSGIRHTVTAVSVSHGLHDDRSLTGCAMIYRKSRGFFHSQYVHSVYLYTIHVNVSRDKSKYINYSERETSIVPVFREYNRLWCNIPCWPRHGPHWCPFRIRCSRKRRCRAHPTASPCYTPQTPVPD